MYILKKYCPTEECAWANIYVLTAKVGTDDYPGWVVKAKMNEVWKRALINMGCSNTLIRDLQGDRLPEQMFIKCVHGMSNFRE